VTVPAELHHAETHVAARDCEGTSEGLERRRIRARRRFLSGSAGGHGRLRPGLQVLPHVAMHEDRDEICHPRVAQQVIADTRELASHKVGIELAELASDLRLGLPHPLLERLVARSQGRWILTALGAVVKPRARWGALRR